MSFLVSGLTFCRCTGRSSTHCVHFTFIPFSSWSFRPLPPLYVKFLPVEFPPSWPFPSPSPPVVFLPPPSPSVLSSASSSGCQQLYLPTQTLEVFLWELLSSSYSFLFRTHLINQIKTAFFLKKSYQLASKGDICELYPKLICKKQKPLSTLPVVIRQC